MLRTTLDALRTPANAPMRGTITARRGSLVLALAALAGCGGGGGAGSSASNPTIVTTVSGTATQVGSLATWILVGGSAKPAYSDVYLDSELNPGELFILTQSPLSAATSYTVAVSAVAGAESFSHTWSFTTGGMSTAAPDPITALNDLRGECGVAAMSTYSVLTTSSTKHAGYQAIENGGLTHVETDTANALYVADQFWQRIEAANSANGNAFVGDEEYEDIASSGGVPAIPQLWNTVYHRIPMLRATTNQVGFGDRTSASAAYPAANVPAASAGNPWDYATLDFAANTSLPILASHWPADGASDVAAAFDDSSESPNPIGYGNANGTGSGAPTLIGPPLHIVLPSNANFSTISVSVVKTTP